MNKSTYGEDLFERYLLEQGLSFEREPVLPGISQRIDFVLEHPTAGKVLLEVKDIENSVPSGGIGVIDAYRPIREHIEEGTRKFRGTADYVCGLVLTAPPGSFVMLQEPHIMLGAMYGDLVFRVPFYPRGEPDNPQPVTAEFQVGQGKMVRRSRLQNTRIAALITLHAFAFWHLSMQKYARTEDGRTKAERLADIMSGKVDLGPEDATHVGVTVWENGVSRKKIPRDLFRGPMDAWWEYGDTHQSLTFVGETRKDLGVDSR